MPDSAFASAASEVAATPKPSGRNELFAWWPFVLGLAVLYLPTYYRLATGLWTTSDQTQGPLILMIVLYLFWNQRTQLLPKAGQKAWPILGSLVFLLGLAFYVVGRSQDILMFEIGSQLLVLTGFLLLARGFGVLLALWFPLFFLVFMIPLPGFFIDAVTLPMKIAVSYVADNVLFWFGYPIARSGVILQIGPYELMVADACAGMHTLISLEALGLLYLNLVKHDSAMRNTILAILIVPISFTANVIRVMTLILVTYYFGDAAGQGFVHGFAGLLLFLVALALIMFVDSTIQMVLARHANAGSAGRRSS